MSCNEHFCNKSLSPFAVLSLLKRMCIANGNYSVPEVFLNITHGGIPLRERYNYPADILALGVAFLSGLGSLFIIVTFFLLKDLRRTTSRRILAFISMADLGACVSQAVGALDYFGTRHQCEIQALFTVFFSLAFVMWTSCLALYLYITLARDNITGAKRMADYWFQPIGWGIPLAAALVAYFMGALGSDVSYATQGWCWITFESSLKPAEWDCNYAALLWMLVTIKGWELLSYILVPSFYISIKLHLRRTMSVSSSQVLSRKFCHAVQSIDRKLLLFPLVYVLLRIPGTIRVFLFAFHFYFMPHAANDPLFLTFSYLQALGDNAQGAVNFVLFVVLTSKVRRSVLGFCRRLTCRDACCKFCCTPEPPDTDHLYDGYQEFLDTESSVTFEMSNSNQALSADPRQNGGRSTHRQVQKWFRQASKRFSDIQRESRSMSFHESDESFYSSRRSE